MKTLLALILLSLSLGIHAQRPGDLNTDFGDGGIYRENWNDTATMASDLGIQSNGDLIIPGTYKNSSDLYNVFTLKLDEEGNPPPFGNFSHGFEYDFDDLDVSTTTCILPDDKILIAGLYSSLGVTFYPFVIRLLPDGQLDTEFGDDGVFTNEIFGMRISGMKIVQSESSYSIILCGDNGNDVPQLLMLNDEGAIETSFDSDGMIQFGLLQGIFTDLFIDTENDELYASGSLKDGGAFLVRLNLPDGDPVAGFGIDGVLSFTPAEGFEGSFDAMIVDTGNSTITTFGSYPHGAGDDDIFAYRVMANDGSVDLTFGIAGLSSLRVPVSYENIQSAVLQSDGKYYFGGTSDFNGTSDFFLGRIIQNGIGDTSFGTNGLVLTDLGNDEFIFKIALNADENILYAAGYSKDIGVDDDIVVAAYYTFIETEPPISIDNNPIGSITCFPNPVLDIISIETGIKGHHRVQLYDMAGTELYDENFTGESVALNLEFLQPSVYFILVTLPDKQVNKFKLLKQ
jgi:uncharacterized delta-60 repeat protein